jgi:nucleotide-binding universal stress UspA family protein
MFRKILFPTDFSEGAMRAIQKFNRDNTAEVGECILLHVIDEGHLEDMIAGYAYIYKSEESELKDIEQKLIEKAKKELQEKAEKCKEMMNAKSIKTIVRIGIPHDEIVKVADEENVSLILIPSHGKLTYSHELIGSTTIRVLRKTNKPVLVIKSLKEE